MKNKIKKLILEGKTDLAADYLKKYFVENPYDIENYSLTAVILIERKAYKEALDTINDGLMVDPYNEDLLLNKVYLLDLLGNDNEAYDQFIYYNLINGINSEFELEDFIQNSNYVKESENKKVIQGTMEIANQVSTLTKEINRCSSGYIASDYNYYPSYLNYKNSNIIDLNSFNSISEANIIIKDRIKHEILNNDIFHFHFGTSLCLDNMDLPVLKKYNKKIFMQHWGSDVRRRSISFKYNPYTRVKFDDENIIVEKLEKLSQYIDNCIVNDYEMYLSVKDFYKNIYYLPQAINLDNYKVSSEKFEKFTIVHAPTNKEVKGSLYILQAIERLKKEYDFDFITVENMPHNEAKKIYAKADLIIDQILLGAYGLFAIESMALGKPVITYICDEFKKLYPDDLPIISANPHNIYNVIKHLLDNKECLNELGNKSRRYIEKVHDVNNVVERLIEIYEGKVESL